MRHSVHMAEAVRIDPGAYMSLTEISRILGTSRTEALSSAIEAYRRQLFIEQVNAGYAALRADPEAWAEELYERELWDQANLDGLNRE